MTYKVFSLGCKVNSYECAAISSMLKQEGFIESDESPDIIVINTCSVTATADQKSRQHIRKYQKLFPNSIIFVMGCYAQGNVEYIENEIQPTILVGTSNRNEVVRLIKEYLKTGKKITKVDSDPRIFKYEELGVTSCSENTRAYLKIQDGCNNFCTYCIIPYRRGQLRSRNKEEIIQEAKYLIANGYQEIVLTGIHVGGYGQDLKNCSFSSLVDELSNLENLKSLRISSIEESEIDEHLINLINTRKNIAKHLHIPLQSGSNSVLERMNRKYTKEQFISKIDYIRSLMPEVMISTDIIVGFPNESEEEFSDTYNVASYCFNMIHVFPYSAREGTVAAGMKGQIAPQTKTERVNKLLRLSKELYSKYVDKFINTEVEVLIEQFDKKNNCFIGHTFNYIEVRLNSLELKVGDIIKIKLEKSMTESK